MAHTELRQLRHLVALGSHLSFTKAAREVGITQSALTRSLQAIEDKAQVRLFDRDRGRVSLTEVGKIYLERAANLLREATELDRLLLQTAVAEIGEVHFGITSAVARAILPELLTRELVDRPQLRSRVHVRSPESMIELVQAEKLEFCVCGEQPHLPPSLRTSIIGTLPLSFMVRAGHPLLSEPETLDLRQYPLILSGQMTLGERFDEATKPFIFSHPQIIIDEIGTLAQIATNSDAIWFSTPGAAFDDLRRGDLQELSHIGGLDMSFRVLVFSHNRRTLSPAAKRLIERMRVQAARLISSSESRLLFAI